MSKDLSRRVTVRFSPEIYAHLEAVAGRTERTVSDVVRLSVQGVAVRPLRRKQERQELVRQLLRIGNNLNQETRLLHLLKHRGEFPDSEILLATLQEVAVILRLVLSQLKRPDRRSAQRTTQ